MKTLSVLFVLFTLTASSETFAQGPLSFKVTRAFTSFAATPLAPRDPILFFPVTQGALGPEAGTLLEEAPNTTQSACYFEIAYSDDAVLAAGAGLFSFPWTTLNKGTFTVSRERLMISSQGTQSQVRIKFEVISDSAVYSPQTHRGSAQLKSVTCTGSANSLFQSAHQIGRETLRRATDGFIEVDRAE
jgi:hypothetical protein